MLGRLGHWCHNRRLLVIGAWLALLVGSFTVSGITGAGFTTEFTLPNVESARGLGILGEHFGGQGGRMGGTIVYAADQGVDDPAVGQAMEAFFATVDQDPQLTVVTPYAPRAFGQVNGARTIAFARVEVGEDLNLRDAAAVTDDVEAAAPELPGLTIEYGGGLFAEFQPPESEVLGLGFAIIILILAFGSVLAMGLPIGTAVGGIGVGVAFMTILSNVVTMPTSRRRSA